jgi:hypothetical protein
MRVQEVRVAALIRRATVAYGSPTLGSTAPESAQHAVYRGVEISADAFALAGGCLGERDASVEDVCGGQMFDD